MAGNANPGSKRDKIVRDALRLAAMRVVEGDAQGRIALAVAAEKVMQSAVDGDLAAFKEVADRLDGKAHQSMDVTTTHERSATEWTEPELDAAIERARIARAANGKAAKAEGSSKPH